MMTTSLSSAPNSQFVEDDVSYRKVLRQLLAAFQELVFPVFQKQQLSSVYEEIIYAPTIGSSTVRFIRNEREKIEYKYKPLFIDYLTEEQKKNVIARLDKIIPIIRTVVKTGGLEKEIWIELKNNNLV